MPSSRQMFDIVCVGLGTNALALAASLADQQALRAKAKVLFIEKQPEFVWVPGQILSGASVAAPFTRDLITPQNPRSEFTFLNFLHKTNSLVQFANASQLHPSRALVGNYLRWIADRLDSLGWLRYSHEVTRVSPVNSTGTHRTVDEWIIEMIDLASGQKKTIRTRKVVIAVDGSPRMRPSLSSSDTFPAVQNFMNCLDILNTVEHQRLSLDIAVVGQDQEAAEVFEHLHSMPGSHKAVMCIRGSALRPDDRSPFVAQAWEMVDSSAEHDLPPEIRHRLTDESNPSTNPTVALATIERLYEKQYEQMVTQPDTSRHKFQMWHNCEVVSVQRDDFGKINLHVKDPRTGKTSASNRSFDAVIVCDGYEFSAPTSLFSSAIKHLLADKQLTVDRNYRIDLRNGTVSPGCALWLLGSLQDGSQRTDDLASTAERARRATQSILEEMKVSNVAKPSEEIAML